MKDSAKSMKQSILIIGDGDQAPYHPLHAVEDEFNKIFSPLGTLRFSVDEHAFGLLDPSEYSLCISYIDRWKKEMPKEDLARLKNYIGNGGKLMVIHNGLSYQETSEFAELTGASFTGHPPKQLLQFTAASETVVSNEHLEFTMDEEPYQFEFAEGTEREYFLYYSMNGRKQPAGWITRPEGNGLVMYVMPGHDKNSFQNSDYIDMLRGYVHWLAAIEH